MLTTRPSLLERVKDRTDATGWREFYDLYAPLLRKYARRRGLERAAADDVAQDCMRVLSEQASRFEHRGKTGGFRRFLWTVVNHRITDLSRRRQPRQARSTELANLADSLAETRTLWDEAWAREHLAYCMRRVETRMAAETVAAFRMYVLEEKPVETVCDKLNLTPNQVYLAKSRVTKRLRREVQRLLGVGI